MKDDRGIILSSKELYAQKKNKSNSSLILISSKCGTSVKNYLSNSLCPACILMVNKNKALYRFLIDFKKFVKLLSLSTASSPSSSFGEPSRTVLSTLYKMSTRTRDEVRLWRWYAADYLLLYKTSNLLYI
ncbi:hypothetical protein [Brachyspira murdochii]|nr:hypothetical protein [Brachyspira murdochii]